MGDHYGTMVVNNPLIKKALFLVGVVLMGDHYGTMVVNNPLIKKALFLGVGGHWGVRFVSHDNM